MTPEGCFYVIKTAFFAALKDGIDGHVVIIWHDVVDKSDDIGVIEVLQNIDRSHQTFILPQLLKLMATILFQRILGLYITHNHTGFFIPDEIYFSKGSLPQNAYPLELFPQNFLFIHKLIFLFSLHLNLQQSERITYLLGYNQSMHKLSLTFPQEIEEELSLLCLRMPKLCKKEGALGWTSNERIIIVRNGFFQYFSLHSNFVENQVNTLKDKFFKAAVPLDFIHQVNYLPKNKIRKTHLELIFPKNKKVARMPTEARVDDSEVPEEGIRNEDELQKWVFQFRIDVKEYVEMRKQESKQQKRKKAVLQPLELEEQPIYINQTPSYSQRGRKNSFMSQSTALKFTDVKQVVQKKDIQDYVQSVQKTKLFLKQKAQLAEEEASRQRKKKEREMAQLLNNKSQSIEDQYYITSFWRDYFKAYQQVVKESKEKKTLQFIIDTELNLLKQVQYFNTVASKLAINYVNQRYIGWEGSKQGIAGFQSYQGLWLKVGGKELNQQFLVNYYLNDIFFSLRESKNIKFRLPLMSLIKYKGFKILVMCDLPFSEIQKTEVYNLTEEGSDLQLTNKLKQNLQVFEDILNVKSQPIEVGEKKKISAPLGLHLRIYQYNYKKDRSQDQTTLPQFYYVVNPGIVFPLDYLTQKERTQPLARLRPQLVAAYRDFYQGDSPQLLTQAFMHSTMPYDFKKTEDEKVIDASKWLQRFKIGDLIDKLNRIDLLIVDSYSLKKMMEQKGINVRHMHLIYDAISLPYVRQHILAEALARTIKKQFRFALGELQKQQRSRKQEYQRMKNPERVQIIKERLDRHKEQYSEIAVDFLNLIFGSGSQTKQFWNIIIVNCQKYFKIESSYPTNVKPGLLLHAVLWHCGLKATYDKDIPLFKSNYPFNNDSKIEFKVSVKTFDYPSFEIQKLFRSAPSLEDKVSLNTMKVCSSKLLKLELLFQNSLRFSFQSAVCIAKMSNFKQFLTLVQMENPLHPAVLPYYLINKSQSNFYKALDIVCFSLPDSHPLIVTLHLEYCKLLEPQLMKKTALMMAIRNFGQFHIKTTDIYSKFYHQGDTEHHVKVLRVTNVDSCKVMCSQMFKDQKYQSCLSYCIQQIQKMNSGVNAERLGAGNFQSYLSILNQGLQSSIRIVELKKGILISEQISNVLSSFKYKDQNMTFNLFKRVLILNLLLSNKKYFLYKLVLLSVHIRSQHENTILDQQGCSEMVSQQEQDEIIEGLSITFYGYKSHSKWIKYIIDTLTKSFQYFNFLEDLFNNYSKHIRTYNNETFRECLGYWDLLIRLYGQSLFKETLYDVRLH